MKSLSAKILTVAAICLIVFSCKKNDNKGKLGLILKDVNSTTFKNNEVVIFNFEINHPVTETVNDSLFIRRKFITCEYSNSLTAELVPQYTSTANIAANYELQFLLGSGGYQNICTPSATNTNERTDSLYYTFWIKDKNGVLSDSVTSPKIILKK